MINGVRERQKLKTLLTIGFSTIGLLVVMILIWRITGLVEHDNLEVTPIDNVQTMNDVIATSEPEVEGEASGQQATPNTLALGEVRSVENNNQEKPLSDILDPYETIQLELDLLKDKDILTTEKYFGMSEVFTPDKIADRLAATVVTFISKENLGDGSNKVILHICTLDYNKMQSKSNEVYSELNAATATPMPDNEADSPETLANMEEIDIDSEVKKEVAKGVVTGDFEVHYTIPIIVKDGSVVVTEELKQALTGNWYTGIGTSLKEVECPLKETK